MHDHPDFPSVIGGRCANLLSLCHAVALQRQREQTCTARLNVFLPELSDSFFYVDYYFTSLCQNHQMFAL